MLQKANANILFTEKNLRTDVREKIASQMSSSWYISCMEIDLFSSTDIIQDFRYNSADTFYLIHKLGLHPLEIGT